MLKKVENDPNEFIRSAIDHAFDNFLGKDLDKELEKILSTLTTISEISFYNNRVEQNWKKREHQMHHD